MEKLIIENHTNKSMYELMQYIEIVLIGGRVSGRGDKAQYCYHTSFNDNTQVSTFKNKKSDRFVIYAETPEKYKRRRDGI